jgi:CheY-like chemotaxis protein
MNKEGLKTSEFPFLERAINVLIVDDEYSVAVAHTELLSAYKLYNVVCAASAKEAEALLSSSRQFHVCLFDLGITDINGDEFYLLKKYSSKISFIVVSGRDSLEKGFLAGVYGARAVINKPLGFHYPDVFDCINKAFFRNLIIPNNLTKCKPIIKDAVEALIARKPADIKHWASSVGIEARYLRRVWVECFRYPPRHVLRLFEIFSQVFSYYKYLYCEEFGINKGRNDIDVKDLDYTNKRFKLLYRNNKNAIKRILGPNILSD